MNKNNNTRTLIRTTRSHAKTANNQPPLPFHYFCGSIDHYYHYESKWKHLRVLYQPSLGEGIVFHRQMSEMRCTFRECRIKKLIYGYASTDARAGIFHQTLPVGLSLTGVLLYNNRQKDASNKIGNHINWTVEPKRRKSLSLRQQLTLPHTRDWNYTAEI
jgi:hypothetical protein